MNNKEAIEYLKEVQSHIDLENGGYTQEMYDAIDMAIKALEERPTGKWIHLGGDDWCCSECGRFVMNEGWENPSDVGDCYCPTCGADMRKEAEND